MAIRSGTLIVWAVLGLVPGLFGLKYLGEAQSYIARSVETTASIQNFVYSDDGVANHSKKTFTPWVGFELPDGSSVSAPINIYTENDVERIGESVTILYDPNDISRVRVKSFASLYLVPTIFLGIAAALLAFGAFCSTRPRRAE